MSNVVSFDDYKPHLSGQAMCLQCKYRWVSVAPVGTVELECPECHTWKGSFEGLTSPDEVWQCDCGNQHFYLSNAGACCAKCGTYVS